MATQPNIQRDWPAGSSNGFNYGADKVLYPFINYPTKDTNTKAYEVSRKVAAPNYLPQPALATYSGDPNAYLVFESDLQIDTLQEARYLLRYANIPGTQTLPTSPQITRPVMHDVRTNTNYGVSFDLGYTSTIFIDPPNANYESQSNVAVGVTQINHGGVPGDPYAVWSNGKLVAFGLMAFPGFADSPNQWAFYKSDIIGGNVFYIDHAAFAKNANYRYVNGPISCPGKRDQYFYLPTITPNINVVTDIPVYNPQTDPVSWLDAVVANVNYAVAGTTELAQWQGTGPILTQEVTSVYMPAAKVAVNVVG